MPWLIRKLVDSRFFVIFLLTFVNGLSMTMLFPVLPFLVKNFQEPEYILGILLATFSFFQFIAAPIFWAVSDMYGRKPILLITQAGTFLSWIILGISALLPHTDILGILSLPIFIIFVSRMFDGITWGNISVAQAILSDLSKPEERSKTFWMNAAFFGLALIVWPALWWLTLWSSWGYLATAILGASISLVTLWIMFFLLEESLQEEKRKQKMKISFRQLNIVSQMKKWGHINTVKYTIIMKACIFFGFVGYTSISTLYLIDRFWFTELQTGLYLTFTWSFLIFHQMLSIRKVIERLKDRKSLLLAMGIMSWAFFLMGLTGNIIIFTCLYFFLVLGISLSFATLNSLLSRSVDAKNQGEIMGMNSSFESFISIGAPIVFTSMYTLIPFSPYLYIAFFPLWALLISRIFFRNIEFHIHREL